MILQQPIDGEIVRLASLKLEAGNGPYRSWMNDPETVQYMESRYTGHSAAALSRYIAAANEDPDILLLGIFLRDDKRYVGNIKLGPVRPAHRRADIGLMVGDRTARGRGVATEAIALITDYGFEQLTLHKIGAGIYANNVGSIRAFEKAGFRQEGRRPSHYLYAGRWVDEILMGRINHHET